jgi:hypothetical protein
LFAVLHELQFWYEGLVTAVLACLIALALSPQCVGPLRTLADQLMDRSVRTPPFADELHVRDALPIDDRYWIVVTDSAVIGWRDGAERTFSNCRSRASARNGVISAPPATAPGRTPPRPSTTRTASTSRSSRPAIPLHDWCVWPCRCQACRSCGQRCRPRSHQVYSSSPAKAPPSTSGASRLQARGRSP